MTVSPYKTFSAGETLVAADLNNSFTQITNNGEDLGWPATKAKDLDASSLILDGDGDTSITSDTDDRIDFALQGADLFRMDGTTATSVNGFDFVASDTTNAVQLLAQGTDTDIDIGVMPKGTGAVGIGNTSPAVMLDVTGAITASGAIVSGGDITLAANIVHAGDTNNLIAFTTDAQSYETGGTSRLDISDSGVRFGAANARVTTVLDEDAMGSDSATALATQQSIKAYVDGLTVVASQAEQETSTAVDRIVTPGRQHFHPSATKLWGYVDRSAGTPSLSSPSYNITSVTDDGAGQTIVTVATDLSTAVYNVGANAITSASHHAVVHTLAAGTFKVITLTTDTTAAVDTIDFTCWVNGDH